MQQITQEGVLGQLCVQVIQIGDEDDVFLGPADRHIKQFGSRVLGTCALREWTDVRLSEAIRNVDNHRQFLVSLKAMDGPDGHADFLRQPIQ
jgi:hypothetical protein